MSNLKHSLPGVSFAICIMVIGLYGIYQATDFTQNKNSTETIKFVSNYEHHENEDKGSIAPEHIAPIDTLPFAIPLQHPKKESNVHVIAKVLKMISDGIDKNYPSHSDSSGTDSVK
ncbi:hypothetical protein MYP_368 [Sporocytophaga myxococcoides]|uniref:Uncharacterized protein n=1 Tax=Sporocytophaga myxococcoides TaxID=153721 RepID=A0A098L974_9BACT|nr:hypothetical protein [Sporocytophaga myxococcoides]GAL83142.1 hypothetical protein MYP_368 [Sporocytophaga myxococcoides]